jgi:hypothetical protein
MGFRLKCSECRGKFPWEGEWPSHCPLCGVDMSLPDDNVISMPALRSAVTGMHDKVYRDMEKGSEHRMYLAAEMAGVPASEMSHLKITNMRDNVQTGEVYAMPVSNDVTKHMDAMQARGWPTGWQNTGANLSGEIMTGAVNVNGQLVSGVVPSAGAKTRTAIQRIHGQMSGGTLVCDRPALETQAPGYVRRG